MEELSQIGVTNDNLRCLEKLKDSKLFDDLQDAARFAAALALRKKLYVNKNLMKVGTRLNNKWNTGLVDPDYFFRNIIKHLELCEDFGIGLRSLIIIGLDHIYEKIKDKDFYSIGDLLD